MATKKEIQGDEQLHSSLNVLAKSSFIVFGGIVLSKIFTYLYRVMIARGFGPEGYGLYALMVMMVGWFVTFADMGFSHGILRYTSLYRGKNQIKKIQYLYRFNQHVLTIPSIILGIALFVFSDFIALHYFNNASFSVFLKIASILVPLTVYTYLYLGIIRAYEKISWYSFIFNIVQNVAKVAALGILIWVGAGLISIPWSNVAGTLGMFLVAYLLCKRYLPELFKRSRISSSEKRTIRKEVIAYSLPLLFFSIVSTIFYWIDSFSIGYYKGAAAVGLYNAAVPIVLFLSIAPELFMQLFFPLVNREYGKNNHALVKELSKQVVKWIYLVNLPLFILMFFFPGTAINLLFGAEYLEAATALRILAVGGIISSLFTVSNQLMSAIGKTKLILGNIVAACLLNALLNALFIPLPSIGFIENGLGINGAALATVISLMVLNLLLMIQSWNALKFIPFRRKLATITLSALIPTLLLLIAERGLESTLGKALVLSTGFFLVYLLLILLTKSLDANDWKVITSTFKKFKQRSFSPSPEEH